MTITKEAVEAAARAWIGEAAWLDSEESHRTDYMRKARASFDAERHELEVGDAK